MAMAIRKEEQGGDTLSDKLEQYYPHDLFSIFPGDQSETQAWQDIREDIWDSP
jgi:hypothetical protein